jgi:hypothetical protein
VDVVKRAPLDVEELPAPRSLQGGFTVLDVTGKPLDPGKGEELQPQRRLAQPVVKPVIGDPDAVETGLVRFTANRGKVLLIPRRSEFGLTGVGITHTVL